MQIAALAARDLGDRNQPLDILHKVTAVWAAQSVSNTNDKIAVIEQVIEKYPEVGWRLVMTLLKPSQSIIVSSMGPRFRDWELPCVGINYHEVCQFVELVLNLAVKAAGVKSERWVDLVKLLRHLPGERQSFLVRSVSKAVLANSSSWSDRERYIIWRVLTEEIAHHSGYPDAKWAVSPLELESLCQAAKKLIEPSDPRQYTSLFGWSFDLRVGGLSRKEEGFDDALKAAQEAAIDNVCKQGLDAIRMLIASVERPEVVGEILAELDLPNGVDPIICLEGSSSSNLRRAAQAYVYRKASDQGVAWLEQVMASVNLGVEGRSALAAAIPVEKRFWEWAETLGEAFNGAYWRASDCRWIPENQCAEAIDYLLRYDCPLRALDVLFRLKCSDEIPVEYGVVIRVLESFLTVNDEFDRSHYSYVVSQLLKWLEVVASNEPRLALLEFWYFDFIGVDHDPSGALYKLLGSVPDKFVSLVESINLSKGQEGRDRTAANVAFAKLSHSVLYHWKALPGVHESGEVDGDHLTSWVTQCRALFNNSGDGELGDRAIGKVLASSPKGRDGVWPAEEVRVIIESLKNEGVEAGLMTGRYNRQGVSVRPVYDGGGFERLQAQELRSAARKLAVRWPRTSMILRQMADGYEQEANHLDKWDEQLADE